MVRMDKLLDAWRADPRVEPTVELCAMLTRASLKPGARDVIPIGFIVALATEAIAKHPRSIDVLVALAGLYHAAGDEKRATAVLEKAIAIAPGEPRVAALADKLKIPRPAVPTEPAAQPPETPASNEEALRERHAQSAIPPPAGVGPLDAETFDAPTTPLDPPTEPAAGKVGGMPRRSPTSHGLGGAGPSAPVNEPTTSRGNALAPRDPRPATAAGEGPRGPATSQSTSISPATTAGSPSTSSPATGAPATGAPATGAPATGAPTTGAPATGSPSTGGAAPNLSNPRRTRTLLGGAEVLSPPARPAPAMPVPAPSPAPPPVVAPREAARSAEIEGPDSDADQATGVMNLDDGPPTTVDRIFSPGGPAEQPTQQREVPRFVAKKPEPVTVQRDVPLVPAARPEPLTAQREAPSVAAARDEGQATRQHDVKALLPDVDVETAMREVPPVPARAASPARPRGLAPPTPSAPTAVAPPSPDSDPGTSTRVAPVSGDSRPAARRVAARKPVGRGVGTDDPLMKAALARREQLEARADDNPATHAEHDVPTKVGQLGSPATSTQAASSDDSQDDPESVPTRAKAISDLAPPPPRPIAGGLLAAPETTQTEVDSVSEDAPTRTLSAPPPVALPPLSPARPRQVRLSDSQEGPAAGASTFSKVVTTVFKQAGVAPPTQAPWESSPSQGDDSVDTQLRPLAPLAPKGRGALPSITSPSAPSAPSFSAPSSPSFSAPSAPSFSAPSSPPSFGAAPGSTAPRPAGAELPPLPSFGAPPSAAPSFGAAPSRDRFEAPEPDDDAPGTYVMRPDEAAAASRVDPRAPVGVGMSAEPTLDPADLVEEPSHGEAAPPAPSFGPPPAPVVTRGIAFGAGALADPMRPTMPLDFGSPGAQGFDPSMSAFDGGQFPQPSQHDSPQAPMGLPPPAMDVSGESLRFGLPADDQGVPLSSGLDSASPFERRNIEQHFVDSPFFDPMAGAARPGPASGSAPEPEAPRRPVMLYLALGVAAVMVAVLVGYASYLVITDYRRGGAADAPRPAAEIERAVLSGLPADLAQAEAALQRLDGTSTKEIALARVRFRTIKALEQTGSDDQLGPIVDAAHAAGVGADAACGEVALALLQKNPARVDEIVAKEDAGLARDPYFQLAVGVALEERGDPKALERYEAAFAAEPRMMPARVRYVRALVLEGDTAEAEKQLAELPEGPARTALTALAWVAGRANGAPETVKRPSTLPTTAEVPRELLAAYAATSLIDAEKGDPSTLTKRGIDEADGPGVATLFGRIALKRGDQTSALAAASRSLSMGPRYAPALRLLGRTALDQGKFDAMMEVVAKLPPDATYELRSLRAYETSSLDELADIAAKVPESDPAKLLVTARLERLRGLAPLSDDRLARLLASDALGADLVAIDALLDLGRIQKAKEIVSGWPDATTQPLRARRYARLMRYEGNLDEGLLALGGATTTAGTASLERILLAAEIPKHRGEVIDLLGQRPSPVELPAATARLLEVYVRARNDDMRIAKDLVERAQVPSNDTALPTRICAALAFGEVKDKRAEGLVKSLYASFPENPDVRRAAEALGVAPETKR